ncbi:site-specific integrase [Nitrosococcus watsonii]|uniref:Integrase family protein n=1 Tax=Nitrosococcus watsoni (strain C-113) TaxID=105559 RepID=D8K611_NITWC|nr:site-specific integrase [Nitrosococcus watsonii]ADJ28338.1 integrase family protein [Nitrosococcus watsonii C-113]
MSYELTSKRAAEVLGHVESEHTLTLRQQHYIEAATAENTRRAYRSAIRHFERWGGCLPADAFMVSAYLLAHAEILNPRTLSLRLTALRHWHQLQGFPDPTVEPEVRKLFQGIVRRQGKPKRQAKTFRLEHLKAMVNHLSAQSNLKAYRDRALLLVGFFGAFRRSELVQVDLAHLQWEAEGILITIPRSKTDQSGEGRLKALPYGESDLCPVTALKAWLKIAGIKSGPLFRRVNRWETLLNAPLHPAGVNLILKAVASQVGFDFAPELSSHSLRRSLATTAHRAGASFESIKRQGGWGHDGTVWAYIEAAGRFEENAAAVLLTKRQK